jgi:hypothetical protein
MVFRMLSRVIGQSTKRNFRRHTVKAPTRESRRSASLSVESLEDRCTPAVLTVTSSLDNNVGATLRDEIAAAHSGDTIIFKLSLPATITLDPSKGELVINKNLMINGPGAGQLSVSGNNSSRVFEIMGSAKVAINGLTVADGFVSGTPASDFGFTYVGGGGILVDFGAQLNLLQDTITANHALSVVGSEALGGGLMNLGTTSLVGCAFTNNQATGGGNPFDSVGGAGGGAVDNFGGPSGGAALTASNCTFANNLTSCASDGIYFAAGGALENDAGLAGSTGVVPFDPQPSTAVVSNCVFSNNDASAGLTANGQGGAAYNTGVGTVLTLSNCTINGNRASGGDGGDGGATTGYSEGQGGGLYNAGGSTLNVVCCTVTNNEAIAGNNGIISNSASGGAYVGEGIGGGILNNFGGTLIVTNSTISGNVAQGSNMTTQPGPGGFADGGGIANTAGFSTTGSGGNTAVGMTVTNCVISNNSAIGGQGNAGVNGLMAPDQQSGFGFGGGIDNSNGGSVATISNTVITGNHAIGGAGGAGNNGSDGLGGGIGVGWTILLGSAANTGGVDGSTITLNNSTVSCNSALGGAAGSGAGTVSGTALGGGLAIEPTCTATVRNSTINNNTANGSQSSAAQANGGGGIDNAGTLTLTQSWVNGNQAVTTVGNDTLGGGLLNNEGKATITNSTFNGDESFGGGSTDFFGGSAGGGIDNYEGGTLVISNSTFANDEAISAGGGYYYATGGALESDAGVINKNVSMVTITNSSFINNEVTGGANVLGNGGGIDSQNGTFTMPGLLSMTLIDCTISGNRSVGGGGGNGVTTGDSEGIGGGLMNAAGTMNVFGCIISNNQGIGGNNAIISANDPYAGAAFGGGIENNVAGVLNISNSWIVGNTAQAGATSTGPGSFAVGGGISNSAGIAPGAVMNMTNCVVSGNSAMGGHGGPGVNNLLAPGQQAGFGFGGGIDVSHNGGTATIINSSITNNRAVGGAGGQGNNGSDGLGGGIGVGWATLIGAGPDNSTVTLINSVVNNNVAQGGKGGAGANGGDGLGGGIFLTATTTVTATNSKIEYNQALGGEEGNGGGGSDGQGIGGGVYNDLGTFDEDLLTVLAHNLASTSHNNIYP